MQADVCPASPPHFNELFRDPISRSRAQGSGEGACIGFGMSHTCMRLGIKPKRLIKGGFLGEVGENSFVHRERERESEREKERARECLGEVGQDGVVHLQRRVHAPVGFRLWSSGIGV